MGIAAPEQRNLPDPRPMSEAHGEASARVWLVRQGRRQQGGPTGNGRKQEITKRNDYQTAYPVPRPEQLHRNHHAGFLSSGPGETRREQQEVARFGRQSSARCGPSQSRDSRNVAFAKLRIGLIRRSWDRQDRGQNRRRCGQLFFRYAGAITWHLRLYPITVLADTTVLPVSYTHLTL